MYCREGMTSKETENMLSVVLNWFKLNWFDRLKERNGEVFFVQQEEIFEEIVILKIFVGYKAMTFTSEV